jgi:hypothetical protein
MIELIKNLYWYEYTFIALCILIVFIYYSNER